MQKTLKIVSLTGLVVASFLLGMYTADKHAVWGNVDLLSKRENKVVELTEAVSFKHPDGSVITLDKGAMLNWEGFYNHQNFLSQRYLIEGFDSFKVVSDAGMTGEFYMHNITPTQKPK